MWKRLLLITLLQVVGLVWVAVVVLSLELPRWPVAAGGIDRTETSGTGVGQNELNGKRSYSRLVLMLVDALREDFVHNRTEMKYVRQMIEKREALSFVSYADTPTVTMPRIKALMTGAVPRFIDVMNNLDSKALTEDSLIHRFKEAGYRMVMYGDETWLKLFPTQFARHDGTSSFFTKDFTEVDDNITRHFLEDFDPKMAHPKSADWDCAILHYLGMDHIGHQHGPDSFHMTNKLREMDTVFEDLHRSLAEQELIRKAKADASGEEYLPTLLLLLSDHGMNKVGNHGGASVPESSAFLLMSHVEASGSKIHDGIGQRVISQVDIAPTLGTLFGIGVPNNSVGKIIKEAFEFSGFYHNALKSNGQQLYDILTQHYPHLLAENSQQLLKDFDNDLEAFLFKAHEKLINIKRGGGRGDDDSSHGVDLALAICLVLFGFLWICLLCKPYVSTVLFQSKQDFFLVIGLVIHVITFTSSSFIENEHVVWYFIGTTWWFFFGLESGKSKALLVFTILICLRILRSRLQIINFARLASIESPPFIDEGAAVLVMPTVVSSPLVVIGTLLGFVISGSIYLVRHERRQKVAMLMILLLWSGTLLVMSLKAMGDGRNDEPLFGVSSMTRARLVYTCCFVLMAWSRTIRDYGGVVVSWNVFAISTTLLMFLLHRNTSTIVVGLGSMATYCAAKLAEASSLTQTFVSLWILGQCVFFSFGNSHVIATVDISGAYTGLSGYNQTIVVLLTAIITFSGPIMSVLHLTKTLAIQPNREHARAIALLFQAVASLRILVITIILIAMRTHLFIWSVFAPKWMYETLLFLFSSLTTQAILLVISLQHQNTKTL